ncbi:tyrosine-type recombinase/integrase [Rubrimonas cliftonensis]|uniref:Site-specific recombinase XerD n=1 Tax=Rubrimonas cliftonensis TaxID=89524 RepID=A0A1H4FYF4_9RHOB|nr:tyrosine-type recombinase/integrase [Rubrimonas cliftonensis]SEB02386.1 Site-specific recombinase XerD [Rubrimonas cliftonensis]
MPTLVLTAGVEAQARYWEFFGATIRSRHTRRAYRRAIEDFLGFCADRGAENLVDLTPLHVGAWVEGLGRTHEPATVKARLAAVRSYGDWITASHIIPYNPAAPVRGPRHVVRRGNTPALSREDARRLVQAIDVSSVVGLRDRALVGVMLYALARVGAAVGLRVGDLERRERALWLRLREKGGRIHETPASRALEGWLLEYVEAAGIAEDRAGPLFRSTTGRSRSLTPRPLLARNAYDMIRRRTRDAGLDAEIGCHSLRATGITLFLDAGGALETAQALAGHASPRTTQLYDRRGDAIAVAEVERIVL